MNRFALPYFSAGVAVAKQLIFLTWREEANLEANLLVEQGGFFEMRPAESLHKRVSSRTLGPVKILSYRREK